MTTITSSPVAAVEEALERIDAWDTAIRAFAHVDAVGARRHAAAIERLGRERGGPLFGYALGVKDLIDTGDMPTSYGSPIFAGHRPDRDAHVVRRIRRAGAVVVGKTVTTEFATFDPPPTRNPWDLACTPGGSSAGSAAAVAAGMVPAALGTQTAGSVLRPASYCGVVGFMPSPGWIGRTGIFECAPSLDRVGFLARTVDDLIPLLAATAGIDAGDPASIRRPRAKAGLALTPGRLRVGVLAQLLELATPAMAATVARTADRLARDGADVRSIAATETFEGGFAALHTVMRAEMAVVHRDLFAKHRRSYSPRIARIVEAGQGIQATEYISALKTRHRFRTELDTLLDDVDVLLAPAAVGAAERSHDTIGDPLMNIPATFAGLPALAIPAELSEDGLPLGVQLIGRRNDDHRVLEIARWFEGLLDFRARPPEPRAS